MVMSKLTVDPEEVSVPDPEPPNMFASGIETMVEKGMKAMMKGKTRMQR